MSELVGGLVGWVGWWMGGWVDGRITSKQILPFAFEEQHSAVSAHFTSKQKLPFAIREYSYPENPGLIRKNTMYVLGKS